MTDNQLNRLFRAAAQESNDSPVRTTASPARTTASPARTPLGFETRVIAHWLSESGPDWRSKDSTLAIFRRALGFACAITIVSLGLSYQTLVSSPSPELAIADNALEIDFTP